MAENEKENGALSPVEVSSDSVRSTGADQEIGHEKQGIDFRTVIAIFSLAVGYEAGILSSGLPGYLITRINADIGPSTHANWIAGSWSLAAAVSQIIVGRFTDIFGRRYLMIGGNFLGLIGCAIASQANSINMVIAGATLAGVAAGAQVLAYACVNELVSKKNRGVVLGIFNLTGIPGAVFGAPIAYSLISYTSWRWSYYIPLIVNGCAIILLSIFYWPPNYLDLHPEGKTAMQHIKEMDFLGLFLFASGLTLFLVELSLGGNPWPWTSGPVLGPLLAGALTLFALFPAWEIYCPERITKLIPPSIFKNVRGFTIPLITVFVSGMLLYSLLILWPQQVQLLYTKDPAQIGWYSMPLAASASLGGTLCGLLFAKIKHTKWQLMYGICSLTLFLGLMSTVNQHTIVKAIAFVVMTGLGIAYAQIVGLLTIQLGASDRDIGTTTALVGVARSTGGSVGLSVYSAVINNKVSATLVPKLAAAALGAGLAQSDLQPFIGALTTGSAQGLAAIKSATPAIIAAGSEALVTVYSDAFSLTYLVSLSFGAIAIGTAFFVNSVDDLLTTEVAVTLKKPHVAGFGKGDNPAAVEKDI